MAMLNNQMANMIWLVLWNHGMDRSWLSIQLGRKKLFRGVGQPPTSDLTSIKIKKTMGYIYIYKILYIYIISIRMRNVTIKHGGCDQQKLLFWGQKLFVTCEWMLFCDIFSDWRNSTWTNPWMFHSYFIKTVDISKLFKHIAWWSYVIMVWIMVWIMVDSDSINTYWCWQSGAKRREWMGKGEWDYVLLLIVIVEHSLIPY